MYLPWENRFSVAHARPLRTVYFGTPDIAVPALKWCIQSDSINVIAVVSQPDRKSGRGQKKHSPAVAGTASENNLLLLQPEALSDIRTNLENYKADLFIVFAYGKIFPKWMLALPEVGPLNLHASLLPRHRGAAPIQAAIAAGDCQSGVTLMGMEPGMDSGPILHQHIIQIERQETAGTLHDKIADAGPLLLSEGVDLIQKGKLNLRIQEEQLATYAAKIDPEAAKIGWCAAATDIDRLVRAMSPYPGAHTKIQDNRTKIYSGQVAQIMLALEPGAVHIERDHLYVGTGDGAYEIVTMQPAGKRRMTAAEYLKGHLFPPGLILA